MVALPGGACVGLSHSLPCVQGMVLQGSPAMGGRRDSLQPALSPGEATLPSVTSRSMPATVPPRRPPPADAPVAQHLCGFLARVMQAPRLIVTPPQHTTSGVACRLAPLCAQAARRLSTDSVGGASEPGTPGGGRPECSSTPGDATPPPPPKESPAASADGSHQKRRTLMDRVRSKMRQLPAQTCVYSLKLVASSWLHRPDTVHHAIFPSHHVRRLQGRADARQQPYRCSEVAGGQRCCCIGSDRGVSCDAGPADRVPPAGKRAAGEGAMLSGL